MEREIYHTHRLEGIIKISILPKLIHMLNIILIKIQERFLVDLNKSILKCMWKDKEIRTDQHLGRGAVPTQSIDPLLSIIRSNLLSLHFIFPASYSCLENACHISISMETFSPNGEMLFSVFCQALCSIPATRPVCSPIRL